MLFALLLAATAPANHDEIVARVGADVVMSSQLATRIATTRAARGTARPEALVEDLVNEAIMAREGVRLGLGADPAVVQKVEAERRRLAAERFLEKDIDAAATVDEARLAEMFHLSADSVHLQQIVLATKEEAEAALARLRNGARVTDEASRSLDPAGVAKGGDLGTRFRGQLDRSVEEVAFGGPIGVFTGPVQLGVGWSVVRVSERRIGDAAAFAAQKEALRRFAESQARGQYRKHYVSQLRKKEGAKIDEAFLRSTGTRLDGTPAEAEHVVATAASKVFRYREVSAELRRVYNGAEGGHYSGLAVKSEIAWSLVDRALLEAEAMARGYGNDPAIGTALLSFERDEVVRALAGRLREAVGPPSAEDVKAHYRAHLGEFSRSAHAECAHILLPDRAQAQSVRERLAHGESFDDMAREYSKDAASATRVGLLGDFTDERIASLAMAGEPALAAAFRDANPDQVSVPVKSQAGWHLVRCAARVPASTIPFAEVREAISARLAAERRDDAVRRRIAELRAKVQVSVDITALRRAVAQARSHGS